MSAPIYVGRKPPPDADVGTLWLDTVEVVAMVLLELPSHRSDRPPSQCYLSLRPVMGWQFQAFLKLGRFVERILQLQPFRPAFDGARSADAFAPMTNLLHGECELYANWFGKDRSRANPSNWTRWSRCLPCVRPSTGGDLGSDLEGAAIPAQERR